MWGYSQLYSEAWSYQADAPELVAQIGQVVLSGSKAMMLFQANLKEADGHKLSTLRDALRNVKVLGEEIRIGDIGGASFTSSSTLNKDVMVETILTPERLLVAMVNTDASGYSNLLCHTGTFKHWRFKKHTVDKLTITLPPGATKLTNWQEARKGELTSVKDVSFSSSSTDVELKKIELDDDMPMRLLVADVAWAQAPA